MQFGYGTTFSRFNGAYFEVVAGLIDLQHFEATRGASDTTEIDDTTGYKEFDPTGLRDPGEMSIVLEWNQADSGQSTLSADFDSPKKKIYRVTYPGGETATFAGFITSWGKAVPMEERTTRTVKFKLSGKLLNGANLLQEAKDAWVVDTSGDQGDYIAQGAVTSSSNKIFSVSGPNNITQPVWQINGEELGGGICQIGSTQGFDSTKPYRFSVWATQQDNDLSKYLGCNPGVTDDLSGNAVADPFFLNGVGLTNNNQWVLMVGVLHGSGYLGSDSGVAGVYNSSGTKITDGAEFKSDLGATIQSIRFLVQNELAPLNAISFASPRIEEFEGAIPLEYFFN